MKGATWSQCFECKHRLPQTRLACKAFPNGVPREIFLSDHNHREPFVGDNGYRFEMTEETKALKLKFGIPIEWLFPLTFAPVGPLLEQGGEALRT
jgi:hypothetical protein